MGCDEDSFLFIWLEHRDLMVSGKRIYERKHPMSGSGVDNIIYLRQMEAILWASIVQIGIVNTNLPLSLFFWNNHYIRQPIRRLHFSDKSGCQQLVYLRLDDLLPIQVEASDLLVDGSQERCNIKLV